MHFYQFNIGDYRKDTSHLSILEHGVYRLLLDTYYATELPLTTDIRQLSRMHCLRSADEKAALDVVLSDFFLLTESGYRHNGCDKVLAKVYEKSEKARQSAQKKWDRAKEKKCERMEKECERIKNGCERIKNACEQDALDMLPITHNPLPNTQENLTPSDDGPLPPKPADRIPYDVIFDLFVELCPSLPSPRIRDDKRKSMIRSVWKMDNMHQSTDFFRWLFDKVEKSDFLTGRKTDYRAGFDFVCSPRNLKKIVEGNYDNR